MDEIQKDIKRDDVDKHYENKPIGFRKYKEFREIFNTEKVYTRQEMADMQKAVVAANRVNRVVLKGKDVDVPLKIEAVRPTEHGLLVIVSNG